MKNPDGVVWQIDPDDGILKPYTADGKRIVWAAQPGAQWTFLRCPVGEALLEGPRGGGKTDCLLMDFLQHVGQGFGAQWKGILFRHTFPELEDVIAKSKQWFPQLVKGATYNESKSFWHFPTGETLKFRPFETKDDYWKYHGHSYPWIGWEELTTWPSDECYKSMFSTWRSTHPNIPRKYRATTNPSGCVPFGEVLTAKGWTDIRFVEEGDSVVSFDRQGHASLSQVTERTERFYEGDIIVREGRGLRMYFTPNHRLPLLLADGHKLRAFHDCPGETKMRGSVTSWEGTELGEFRCPQTYVGRKRRIQQPSTLSERDYAELMGWYLSEGCTTEGDPSFSIAQCKPRHRATIEALLRRAGFVFSTTNQGFTVYSKDWFDYFKQFGKSTNKHVPRDLLNATAPTLRVFLNAVVDGDGHRTKTGFSYSSLSQQLRDDVAEAAVKLGYRVSFYERQRPNRTHRTYEVSASRGKPIVFQTGNHVYNVNTYSKRVDVELRPFSGKVYCLKVPGDESFVIRQGKNVWLSGNSGHNWVKARFRLPIPPGKTIGPLIQEEGCPDRVAVHSELVENRVLMEADPSYRDAISAAARNPAERKAWLEGSWDVVAGGMFDDVWLAAKHVVPPFEIPLDWKLDRAFDWGSSKPFSVGWWAESNGTDVLINGKWYSTVPGDLFRVQEWYGWNGQPNEGCKMLARDIAAGIVQREIKWGWLGRVQPGPADSAIFTVENGVSIAKDMMRPVRIDGKLYNGIQWTRSDKRPGSRKTGWEMMRKMFEAGKGPDGRPREEPGLFVVEHCEHFLRTIPVLPRDLKKDADDVDTKSEDHIADETRYRVRYVGRGGRMGKTEGMI